MLLWLLQIETYLGRSYLDNNPKDNSERKRHNQNIKYEYWQKTTIKTITMANVFLNWQFTSLLVEDALERELPNSVLGRFRKPDKNSAIRSSLCRLVHHAGNGVGYMLPGITDKSKNKGNNDELTWNFDPF